MNGLILRAIGGVIGLALLVSAAWLIRDRFHQKALADDARACAAAASDPEDRQDLKPCLRETAAEIMAARQARVCESALLPTLRDETRFLMAQACGAGVKHLVVVGDAAASERDAALAQLAASRADAADAVLRAERRTQTKNERIKHADQTIQAAPRDAAGNVRCDADCLRRLAQ